MDSLSNSRMLIDVKVPMRDSVNLSTDIYMPRGAGPFPAVLMRTPYSNNLDQCVEKGRRPVQRPHFIDHRLDVGHEKAVFLHQGQALFHQLVVIGNVPGRRLQGVDAGAVGDFDPDFRNQDAFQVKADEIH